MAAITLPDDPAPLEVTPGAAPTSRGTPFNRHVFAAAHVAAMPGPDGPVIDWDATLAWREWLWSLAPDFGIAEAMDTSGRGMGLEWTDAETLIARSLERANNRPVAVGCGTDHVSDVTSLDDVVRAYEEQIDAVQSRGGSVIVMASRVLAATAKGPEDYAYVYERVFDLLAAPAMLHWLGDMFDPALRGYWGSTSVDAAMDRCLELIEAHRRHISGVKISLLDKNLEIAMRARLPDGVDMYTGDDFNFPELIRGADGHHSHALLGILDAIGPQAVSALESLAADDPDTFSAILEPLVPLSRHVFCEPTQFYKTGLVFLAWLNGHQEHFLLLGGHESSRDTAHLVQLFRLAAQGGLLTDPDLAVARMQQVLGGS